MLLNWLKGELDMKKLLCGVLLCSILLSTLSVVAMTADEFENWWNRGKTYYEQGLYYEAIDELQALCDAYWYDMNSEQQERAVCCLWQSKNELADYLFNTGIFHYNNGLYYEAQSFFAEVLVLSPEHTTLWQRANDYLYNTNQRIKEWEGDISVKPYLFDMIGKTRTQTEEILGKITESIWYNGPLYEHNYDSSVWLGYDDYAFLDGGGYMAPQSSRCTAVYTTIDRIVDLGGNNSDIYERLKKVFKYEDFQEHWDTMDYWSYNFIYNGFYMSIEVPSYDMSIHPDSTVWISR